MPVAHSFVQCCAEGHGGKTGFVSTLLLRTLRGAGARLFRLILLFGVLVGWTRVYLGVLFPFDIVGSLWVALDSGWLIKQLLGGRQLMYPVMVCAI